MKGILNDIDKHVAQAVSRYRLTRKAQKDKQKKRGISDADLRSPLAELTRFLFIVHFYIICC